MRYNISLKPDRYWNRDDIHSFLLTDVISKYCALFY